MTILNREQIDALAPMAMEGYAYATRDIIDTARAYHDLRDAVLSLCVPLTADAPYGFVQKAYLREVVARVERGAS